MSVNCVHTLCTDKGNKMPARISDTNFYTVFGWMLNVLGLKGNELTIFAVIYGFSQDGKSEFDGSISYLQTFANISSKQTVYTMLESLQEKHYIKKRGWMDGKVQRYAYSADLEAIEAMQKGLTTLKPDNSE